MWGGDEKGRAEERGKEGGKGRRVGKGEGKWNLKHSSHTNLTALLLADRIGGLLLTHYWHHDVVRLSVCSLYWPNAVHCGVNQQQMDERACLISINAWLL